MSEEEWDSGRGRPPEGPLHGDAAGHAPHARAQVRSHRHVHVHRRPRGQPRASRTTRRPRKGSWALTRSTALAMAKYGVTVNCISPTAETRMTERLPDGAPGAGGGAARAIAPVVAFLASDRAAHITGQILHVRGNQVSLWSHPAPIRAITSQDGMDAGGACGRLRHRRSVRIGLRRIDALGITWPPRSARPYCGSAPRPGRAGRSAASARPSARARAIASESNSSGRSLSGADGVRIWNVGGRMLRGEPARCRGGSDGSIAVSNASSIARLNRRGRRARVSSGA